MKKIFLTVLFSFIGSASFGAGTYWDVTKSSVTSNVPVFMTSGTRVSGGLVAPASGAGLELYYAAGVSTVLSFDRGTSAAKPIYFEGSNYIFGNSLGGAVGIGSGLTSPNNTIQVKDLINFDSGQYSTYLGYQAGNGNTGDYSTYVGYQAGYSSPSGIDNTSVGFQAGYSNTSGARNCNFGYSAGRNTNTGGWNNFFGDQAGTNNTDGSYNVGIGHAALYSNTTGYYNVGIGQGALYSNTFAYDNIALGYHTAYGGTTGTRNITMGTHGAFYNSTGSDNTIIGDHAASDATTATGGDFNANTIVGSQAGYDIRTSSHNVLIGYKAGEDLVTGGYNIVIGDDQDTPATSTNYHMNIGGTLFGDLTNKWVGVKTTSPDCPLDVTGTDSVDSEYTILKLQQSNQEFGTYSFKYNVTSGFANHYLTLSSYGNSTTSNNIMTWNSKNGYVGIGTVSPTSALYVVGDVSADSFTDRTPYPKSKSEAYEAVRSMRFKGKGVDHESLAPFIRREKKIRDNKGKVVRVEHERDLSATVSALNEVVKDLMDRLDKAEKTIRELKK